MSSLKKVQRAGILQRLRQNKKYWAIIFYSGTRIEDAPYALDFASVPQEVGWTVSGPEVSDRIFAEGLRMECEINAAFAHAPASFWMRSLQLT